MKKLNYKKKNKRIKISQKLNLCKIVCSGKSDPSCKSLHNFCKCLCAILSPCAIFSAGANLTPTSVSHEHFISHELLLVLNDYIITC